MVWLVVTFGIQILYTPLYEHEGRRDAAGPPFLKCNWIHRHETNYAKHHHLVFVSVMYVQYRSWVRRIFGIIVDYQWSHHGTKVCQL